jgi:putative transposase
VLSTTRRHEASQNLSPLLISIRLLAFFDYPAQHWQHLKTTNPIESPISTVLRTKGPGSRAAGLAMAFNLLEAAQDRWQRINGAHLVELVRSGATFREGVLEEEQGQNREAAA